MNIRLIDIAGRETILQAGDQIYWLPEEGAFTLKRHLGETRLPLGFQQTTDRDKGIDFFNFYRLEGLNRHQANQIVRLLAVLCGLEVTGPLGKTDLAWHFGQRTQPPDQQPDTTTTIKTAG